jgi:hypothetical protein
MASTRSLNTRGNYHLEQWSNGKLSSYNTFVPFAMSDKTYLAGDGLTSGQLPDTQLAENPKDIESFLFGIGANNMVAPKAPVEPRLKTLQELTFMDRRVPLIMPEKFTVQSDQRPFLMR